MLDNKKERRVHLRMNKKGSLLTGESIVNVMQWIVFIIVAVIAVVFLIKYLS